MEKINSILKIIIGFALILSFIATFSSCEKKENTENNQHESTTPPMSHDSVKVEDHRESNDWESIKSKVNEEEKEMDTKFDELKAKASKAGTKVKTEVNESVDKLRSEKRSIKNDSLSSDFKERWDAFKVKSKDEIEKLEAKFKKN